MTEKMMYKSIEFLRKFMEISFQKLGVEIEEAKICADILITSDMRGIESHGIGRLRMYVDRIKKGLIEVEDHSEIDYEALSYYLALNYTPAPFTLFKSMRQLLPGHYMLVKLDGTVKILRAPASPVGMLELG